MVWWMATYMVLRRGQLRRREGGVGEERLLSRNKGTVQPAVVQSVTRGLCTQNRVRGSRTHGHAMSPQPTNGRSNPSWEATGDV